MTILRRILLILLAIFVLGAALAFGISGWVVRSQWERVVSVDDPNMADPQAKADFDCILVLGCGVDAQGRPKPMLRDRMTVAVELYEKGWADRLLLSGDNSGPDYNEVGAMETFALEHGVPAEAILPDNEGFSTDASIRRAKEVFGMEQVVIVTQEYHLFRALFLAGSYGLEASGVSATLRTYGPKQIIWSLREVLARDKDFARMVFGEAH